MFVLRVALGPLNMFVLTWDHVSSLPKAIVIPLMSSEFGLVYVFALACFSWREQVLHDVDLYAFRVFLHLDLDLDNTGGLRLQASLKRLLLLSSVLGLDYMTWS